MHNVNPWGLLYTDDINEANVLIMGVPFDGAVSCGKGAALGPERMRMVSRYLPPATEVGEILEKIKICDIGDIPFDLEWSRYFESVENNAYNLFKEGKYCMFLGGDHSVTIPLHKAFGRYCKEQGYSKIGVIHFDSHCDLCSIFEGHIWSHACTERRCVEGVIDPQDLMLLGIRSLEIDEIEFLKTHPETNVIYARDFARMGSAQTCKMIEEHYRDYDAIYFTLDIDVLDPAFAPGTGTPAAGGISTRELIDMVVMMHSNLPIVAMDIVEVAPSLDCSDITVRAALKTAYEVFGCINRRIGNE